MYELRGIKYLTKLCSQLSVDCGTGPVIRPGHIAVLAQGDHGLNGKGHARLALAHCLVFGVMGNIGGTMEDAVDAMAHICPNHTAVAALGMLLDDVSKLAEQGSRLHLLDSQLQTLAGRLHNTDRVGIRLGPVADIVRLVEITVVAIMIQRHVQIDDVAVEEDALVRDAVANNLIYRRADRLGEVVIV